MADFVRVQRRGAKKAAKKPAPGLTEKELKDLYVKMVNKYKTELCKEGNCKEKKCFNAHTEQELRRPLYDAEGKTAYSREMCPHKFPHDKNCPDGRRCKFSHNNHETMYHPRTYKTRSCKHRTKCDRGKYCAFMHDEDILTPKLRHELFFRTEDEESLPEIRPKSKAAQANEAAWFAQNAEVAEKFPPPRELAPPTSAAVSSLTSASSSFRDKALANAGGFAAVPSASGPAALPAGSAGVSKPPSAAGAAATAASTTAASPSFSSSSAAAVSSTRPVPPRDGAAGLSSTAPGLSASGFSHPGASQKSAGEDNWSSLAPEGFAIPQDAPEPASASGNDKDDEDVDDDVDDDDDDDDADATMNTGRSSAEDGARKPSLSIDPNAGIARFQPVAAPDSPTSLFAAAPRKQQEQRQPVPLPPPHKEEQRKEEKEETQGEPDSIPTMSALSLSEETPQMALSQTDAFADAEPDPVARAEENVSPSLPPPYSHPQPMQHTEEAPLREGFHRDSLSSAGRAGPPGIFANESAPLTPPLGAVTPELGATAPSAPAPVVDRARVQFSTTRVLQLLSPAQGLDESMRRSILDVLASSSMGAQVMDAEGNSALSYAVDLGMVDLIPALANARSVNLKNLAGQTPLVLALQRDNLGALRGLVAAGASVNEGSGLLHKAIRYNAMQCSYYLASQPALNRSLVDERGNTVLAAAAERGFDGLVRELLVHETRVNARNANGETPLSLAAKFGHLGVLSALLNTPKPAVNLADDLGRTPLLHALVSAPTPACADAILKRFGPSEIDLNAADASGFTALLVARQRGWHETAQTIESMLSGAVPPGASSSSAAPPGFMGSSTASSPLAADLGQGPESPPPGFMPPLGSFQAAGHFQAGPQHYLQPPMQHQQQYQQHY